VRGLLAADLKKHASTAIPVVKPLREFVPSADGAKVTIARLFERLNEFLADDTIVIADVGNALFGASDLFIRQRTEFLGPAYYASMGFAVPAALGAQMARPELRPLVIVGDGAFQMTGLELSTIARYGLNPVIIVLNNAGYGTERHIHDGPFNDVLAWHYDRVPELLGIGRAFLVETETQLDAALDAAAKHSASYCLLDVHLDPLDKSAALGRLAERLAQRI
jgi:indolepyruvate decarboxylase